MSDNESVDLAPLTDDKRTSSVASSTTTTAYTVLPRYTFSYPTFKPKDKALPFEPHAFWNALLSSSGHPLAKLSVHLTASTLTMGGLIPPDITVALSGIAYLVEKNEAIANEWQYFPFPESNVIPACTPGVSPPRVKSTTDGPSKDAINNAPHLNIRRKLHKEPSPVVDSPPPSTGKNQSAKKRKAQPKVPKSLTTISDESSEDEAPPSKHAKTSGKEKEAEPSTPIMPGCLCSSAKAETAAPKPKKGLGSVDEQIESMIPEIHEKLREMMTEKKKQGFCFIH
ncbi:hypothetical protein B0H14DRAFT_3467552 [Mycena olivaceomarginata]|nr:hypothetical protein B0H14DRAFT_3467552 [Mycena olivaceomarginata]